jgi:CRISPR/Cas system CSM-associated protein Csm3 (group 7 of RAMP superfamily)
MSRHAIAIVPHASLFFGGYSAAQGRSSADTARDRCGLLIPGSAVKGALRESALRLVLGAERELEILVHLFGDEFQLESGKLRFSPLRAAGGDAEAEPGLRHHVTLERARRQAAHQRLFQNRVTPAGCGLRFEGEMEVLEKLTDEEKGLLSAAAEITDQIGGGRGRGLGLVRVELAHDPLPTAAFEAPEALPPGPEVVLVLEVREPLKLGVVKDLSNIEPSGEVLPGSTVRGAVAAAMARTFESEVRTETLEEVFGGYEPAIFGDALPGDAAAVPAPRTLQEPKQGGAPADQALRLCVEALGFLAPFEAKPRMRSAKGVWIHGDEGWEKKTVPRRLITRNARNPVDGRANAGQLFSLESVDPAAEVDDGTTDDEKPADTVLRYFAPVRGSDRQLKRVVEAARGGLLVGGTRSRGLGRVELVDVIAPSTPPLADRHRRWVAALTDCGVEKGQAETTGVLLTLGPLALNQPRLDGVLAKSGLQLLGGSARRYLHGGWNSRRKLPRTLVGSFERGTTFLVMATDGSPALPRLEAVEKQGLGPGRADGWGRVVACHPIHLDCSERRTP